MDAIRITRVPDVVCSKPGKSTIGTLHLTAHHLIYESNDDPEKEMWVPYPLISLVTRQPQTLQGLSPLQFRCRNFETFILSFPKDQDAVAVFESAKELTVITSVTQLYAYNYAPNPKLPTNNGWKMYSPEEEFARMGVGTRTKAWRFTDINKDYSMCSTYPAKLVVPARITDTTLSYAVKFRSRSRLPALTYLHWANFGSITRSSQPMVGLTNNRSVQDEKLVEAIFHSHNYDSLSNKVYGATATNLITDARPTTNAMATFAKGAGTENMDYYKDAKKVYLGVDNIHVMRDSLAKVVDALLEADTNAAAMRSLDPSQPMPSEGIFLDRQALRKSGWLRYISALLDGALLVVRNIHVNSSHVLIHCSDGWDRTAQLSSLAQICLDPFYRTMRGFEILIEKDWLSFGHRFLDRCGHLSSEKFFLTASSNENGGSDAAQAFIASMQNKFTPQHHLKETSPVFHQFIECVRQIQRQYPQRFEFNQRFLERLHYHLYSCQFGTFLHNNEQERCVGDNGMSPYEATISAWDWFNSPEEFEKNKNPEYDPSLDDPKSGDMGVLLPNPKDVRFWHELYGRTDEEMNGRIVTAQAIGVDGLGPIESYDEDPAVSSGSPHTPPAMSASVPTPDNPTRSTPAATLSISTSTPTLPPKAERPSNSRQDSFNAFGSVRSAYSLQPGDAGPSMATPTPRQAPALPKLPDAFSATGFKSMWGKISSNASAAFSNVRDAYEGVASQYVSGTNGPSPKSSSTSGLGGELQTTEFVDREERPSRSGTALDTVDNPWASERSSSPRRLRQEAIRDPFIVHPLDAALKSQSSFPSTSLSSRSTSGRRKFDSPDPLTAASIPLPPSRSPSVRPAPAQKTTPELSSILSREPEPLPLPSPPSAPPGPQPDPLGVGWL